jgi:hypothetical protein
MGSGPKPEFARDGMVVLLDILETVGNLLIG